MSLSFREYLAFRSGQLKRRKAAERPTVPATVAFIKKMGRDRGLPHWIFTRHELRAYLCGRRATEETTKAGLRVWRAYERWQENDPATQSERVMTEWMLSELNPTPVKPEMMVAKKLGLIVHGLDEPKNDYQAFTEAEWDKLSEETKLEIDRRRDERAAGKNQ